MSLQDMLNTMRALHGESGVRELMQTLYRYEDNDLIRYSSILVDDLNDAYIEEQYL